MGIELQRLLQKVDLGDPTTEIMIVFIVGAIGLIFFWMIQRDKHRA